MCVRADGFLRMCIISTLKLAPSLTSWLVQSRTNRPPLLLDFFFFFLLSLIDLSKNNFSNELNFTNVGNYFRIKKSSSNVCESANDIVGYLRNIIMI